MAKIYTNIQKFVTRKIIFENTVKMIFMICYHNGQINLDN